MSSHWASSTKQTRGRSAAATDNKLSVPSPTKKGLCLSEREAKCHPQRILLRPGQRWQLVDHRPTQLVQACEGQLHLGFHPCELDDPKLRSPPCGVAQKGRLSDTGLAPNDQGRALPPSHIFQQPIQHLALAGPAPEPRLAVVGIAPA